MLAESGALRGSIDITNHDQLRYDLVVARLSAEPWLRMAEVDRPYATAIAAGDNVGIDAAAARRCGGVGTCSARCRRTRSPRTAC